MSGVCVLVWVLEREYITATADGMQHGVFAMPGMTG